MTLTLQHFRNTVEILPSLCYTRYRAEHFVILSWLSIGLELRWSTAAGE